MVAGQRRRLLFAAGVILLAAASIAPIQSFDAFWHLATGRWIVENGTLPERDPFGLASDPIPWHDGEWLFQVLLYFAERVVGERGLSVLRGLIVAALFGWLSIHADRRASVPAVILLCAIAWAGADHRLGIRPELTGVICATITIAIVLGDLDRKRLLLLAAIVAIWINLHPSALLAPALAGLALAGRLLAGNRERTFLLRGAGSIAVAALALLANPHGIEGVTAPIRLARVVSSGEFVNLEWLPSAPQVFPLLYLAIVGGLTLFVWRRDRALIPHILLFAFLAVLSIRYVRNHGYFFAALPILLAMAMPRLERRQWRIAAVAAAAAILVLIPLRRGIGLGPDRRLFPVVAVDQIEKAGLEGNIYNPDQFGGYLIWRFYPQRRVLTDGRNELYLRFLREFPRMRQDSRLWSALFERHRMTLAVEEYRRGTVEARNAVTGETMQMPPSLVYFPRQSWALIGFDDVAMAFARRDAYPPAVIERLEYRMLIPEVPGVSTRSASELARAAAEIERARSAGISGWRLERMAELVNGGG